MADAIDPELVPADPAMAGVDDVVALASDDIWQTIGHSRDGRPLAGCVIGQGSRTACLLGGAHADEPVGPTTLIHLARWLKTDAAQALCTRWRFVICPHVNPDGAAANQPWVDAWPDAAACLRSVVRELPGDDIEFGYPSMRPENSAVSAFMAAHGPYDLHMSLHGMLVSEGGMLLIERGWIDRTADLRAAYTADLAAAGLGLYDHDRGGDKGFEYIGPGYTTTPRGAAMREHFEAAGDASTAALFHDSSMEYAQRLGGDPLCLVTELPLFVLRGRVADPEPGRPTTYLAFRAALPKMRMAAERGQDIGPDLAPFDPIPMGLAMAMRLQVRAINLGMVAAEAAP